MTYVSTFAVLIYLKISVKRFLLYLIRREAIFRGKSRYSIIKLIVIDRELLINDKSSSGFSQTSSLSEELGDIYELSIVFDRIIKSTDFSHPRNRELALNLVSRMKDLNQESRININDVSAHQWFRSGGHGFRISSLDS